MLGFFKEKRVKVFILDIIFTVLLVSLLLFVRSQSRSYFEQVQSFSQDITAIEQQLSDQASAEEVAHADAKLSSVDKILTKSILLNTILFPLALLLLWFIVKGLVWKLSTGVSFKRFMLVSVVPLMVFAWFIFYCLDYISFTFFNDTNASLIVLVLILGVLLVLSYGALMGMLKPHLSFRQTLSFTKRNVRYLFFPFLILVILTALYLFFIVLIFVFTYVSMSFMLPAILLLGILLLLNYQRLRIVRKAALLE